ncbi:MAG: hypothetical protein QNJ14_00980 [Woeseiaceae bacterium]|nr:hypothetical protein [Woeseiaceae bacterium]
MKHTHPTAARSPIHNRVYAFAALLTVFAGLYDPATATLMTVCTFAWIARM